MAIEKKALTDEELDEVAGGRRRPRAKTVRKDTLLGGNLDSADTATLGSVVEVLKSTVDKDTMLSGMDSASAMDRT